MRGMAEEDLSKQEEGDTVSVSCGCFLGSNGYAILHNNEEGNRQQQVVRAKWSKFNNFLPYTLRFRFVKFRNRLRLRFVNFRIDKKPKKLPFHYDPKSYALNFDNGGSPTNPPVVVTNLGG